MRGLKKQNFWVMEQQSGGGGWGMVAVTPKPGELRLWTYQSIAHGADGILYFRWRTCRSGTEQYWQGILEHHGIPGRRYAEVEQVGRELSKIGEIIAGSQVRAQVAIMQSYDTRFAFQVQPINPRFSYEAHIQDWYRGFHRLNIPVDIISEKDPLTEYKVVLVPAMYVLTTETAANLEQFAAAGGIVVFTPRTGIKDEVNQVVDMKLPGLVAKMAGIEIDDYVSMPSDQDGEIQFGLPNLEDEFTASVWADILTPTTAKPVARYSRDYYRDQVAATINTYGNGKVIYLGTMSDARFYDSLIRWIVGLTEINPLLSTPPGVEVAERWQSDQRLLFVLNHTDATQQIILEGAYLDLLSDNQFSGSTSLEPYSVLVLKK
jgi:beta-galactosidase